MILTHSRKYTAVLDACVLIPMCLCDTLLRFAEEPALYRPLWSELILKETGDGLVSKRLDSRRGKHGPEPDATPPCAFRAFAAINEQRTASFSCAPLSRGLSAVQSFGRLAF